MLEVDQWQVKSHKTFQMLNCAMYLSFHSFQSNIVFEPHRDKTKKNGVCAQRRLRSALAFTQSDQSLCCPLEES